MPPRASRSGVLLLLAATASRETIGCGCAAVATAATGGKVIALPVPSRRSHGGGCGTAAFVVSHRRRSAAAAAATTRQQQTVGPIELVPRCDSRRGARHLHPVLLAASAPPDDLPSGDGDAEPEQSYDDVALTSSLSMHHGAVKTSNMEMATAFYGLLGFEIAARFRVGGARAAWLEGGAAGGVGGGGMMGGRIELIEVPPEMLNPDDSQNSADEGGSSTTTVRKRAADRMTHPALLGWDHICLDVTVPIQTMGKGGGRTGEDEGGGGDNNSEERSDDGAAYGLSDWISNLNAKSLSKFCKTIRVALEPRVRLIGRVKYELAFIYDADGGLIELLNCLGQQGLGGDGDGDGDGQSSGGLLGGEESSWDDDDDARIVWRDGISSNS